jgi:asparagine synthase (glutamine-hydrolysing)
VKYDQVDQQPAGDTVDALDALLRQAVESRLLADVPVGAFLSGGLDSSLVVALMHAVSDQPVRTFSIGFEESSFNELKYAREVAEALDTEHHEYTVNYQIEDLIPKMLDHFGEPFADSSAIPTYHLSRVAREEVTVALSGDGGDEVFGGYRRYQARRWADLFNRLPGREIAEWGVECIREPMGYYGKSWRKKARRFVEFARAVREAPETSWGFFLPKRKKIHCMRKNLPILFVVALIRRVYNPISMPGCMLALKV